MLAVLHSEPNFSQLFMAYLLSRNIQVEADLVDHLFNSSEKRLARKSCLLLANIGKDGGKNGDYQTPKISQEILAARVGTTLSRIKFFHEQVPQARLHQL